MLQYSFVLDTAHPRKDNTCSLKVKIYRSNTDYTFIALKIYVRPEQWDGKKIANSITAATDNARLNNYRVAVGRVLLEIDEKGESPTMMEIRARIERSLGKKKEIPTPFITYFMEATSRVATRKTRQSYESTISKIRKFDATDPSFSAITISWLRNFERFCLDGGMSTNAVGVYMRNIRTVYNRAIDDGVAQLNDYPFRRFRIKQAATRKRALSVERLRALRDYPCSAAQAKYRDIFMLIFYLRGINMVDLFCLRKIEDGYVYYSRAKTGRPYAVRVEPEALEIIERYRGKKHLLLFADAYKSHEDFTKRTNIALQSIGAPLADKADKSTPGPAPIDRERGAFPGLTTYWARHSWASVAAGLDVPKETIAAGLGHGGNTVTDIYIDFDQRKIDAANRMIIDALSNARTSSEL